MGRGVYIIDSGNWETIPKGNNRLAALPATSGTSLMLPTGYFADSGPSISVDLTFQVDMAQEINIGTFTPGVSSVFPKGTFNGWGIVDGMTNDPTILRTNQYGLVTSNVYVGTYTISATPGQTMDYKFYIDTGGRYEDLPEGAGDPSDHNNRFLNIANTPTQAMPLVFFKPVSWLGRPGVHLQTTSDLSSGSWQDLLGTDGARCASGQASTNGFLSVTNYPTTAGKTFFRLVKP